MMVLTRIRLFSAFLLLWCLACSLRTAANPISWQQAQQNAQSFLLQRNGQRMASPTLRHVPTALTSAYYIFNIGENEAYTIGAGDDGVPAILGYADTGEVDVAAMPEAMRWWLDEYDHQIRFMGETHLSYVRVHEKSP